MSLSGLTAYQPYPVAFWTTTVVFAILALLVTVHETVPAPDFKHCPNLNLTEAWLDFTTLTRAFHPYNSHNNDEVYSWLLERVHEIIKNNGADESQVTVFDDDQNNVTVWLPESPYPNAVGTYFESNNVMVYIRGKDDPVGEWWQDQRFPDGGVIGKGGVLVNAHFDSVSTSYGATDDGMGSITILQLVRHFTLPGNQPCKGIVLLLNNNEEDWPWGSRAFGNSALMPFCHTFLNLEGVGAGGRANVFRATDVEIMQAYANVQHPFANVVSSDLWDSGVIQSGTDYSVFTAAYGMRGMDMAFYRPRARYHTIDDDARHSSPESLWHMMSNSLDVVDYLSNDIGDTFIGNRTDRDATKVANGRSNKGVWFDIMGRGFVTFRLHTLLYWSWVLLIVSPVILGLLAFRQPWNATWTPRSIRSKSLMPILTFPCAAAVTKTLTMACAYLLCVANPFVIYSHEYTVSIMMMSVSCLSFWAVTSALNYGESSFHRGCTIIWLFIIAYTLHIVAVVFEAHYQISVGYAFVLFHFQTLLCAILTIIELNTETRTTSFTLSRDADTSVGCLNPNGDNIVIMRITEENISETMPLLGNPATCKQDFTKSLHHIFSRCLPRRLADIFKLDSVWLFQLILLVPCWMTIAGQIGLLLVSAVAETGTDGGPLITPYLLVAIFATLLSLSLSPFTPRLPQFVPQLLFVFFLLSAIFNLTVFPFSSEHKYKMFFRQTLDLDTAKSTVYYQGTESVIRASIAQLPSAMGMGLLCGPSSPKRSDMRLCSYDGAGVLPHTTIDSVSSSWVSFNYTRDQNYSHATFEIHGTDTKVCGIRFFEKPISNFRVYGARNRDYRFGEQPDEGLNRIELYRRDRTKPWTVDIEWEKDDDHSITSKLRGQVYCYWDDLNHPRSIPAYQEALQYAPDWVGVTKLGKGVLEVFQNFTL